MNGNRHGPNAQRGIGIVKVLKLIPVGILLLLILAYGLCEANKAYWDYRVQRMCEEDGGVTVYEEVRVSVDEYRRLGGIRGVIPIPERRSADAGAKYVSDTKRKVIHKRNPEVWRTEALIRSVPENREIARYVNYTRIGGDFPTFAHPSAFACEHGFASVAKRIFHIEGVAE